MSKLQVALPPKFFSTIIEFLEEHQDQVSLLLVCKEWSLQVAMSMYRAPPLQSSDSFERLMGLLNTPLPYYNYPSFIFELSISGIAADNLYMGDLDAALKLCTSLQVFRLENCFHISNMLVRSLSHYCQNLRRVDLPGCPITDSFIPTLTKNCKSLESLDLSFTNLTVASLHNIVVSCESLLRLDLSECQNADEVTGLDLSSHKWTRPLKHLNLRNTPVVDDLLRFAAAHCPSLETLIVESCTLITDDSIVKISNCCPKLRLLDCSFCDSITDLSLQAIAVRSGVNHGGSLEHLYMSACDLITPSAVVLVAQKCTKLSLLVLDGCELILGTYIQSYATYQDDLECTLEDDAIRRLASHNSSVQLITPPATPDRHGDAHSRNHHIPFKVGVSYSGAYLTEAEDLEEQRRRFEKTFVSEQGRMSQEPDNYSEYSTASLSRRTSLRRSNSKTSVKDEAERAERQERIRERRRSRGASMSFDRPPIIVDGNTGVDTAAAAAAAGFGAGISRTSSPSQLSTVSAASTITPAAPVIAPVAVKPADPWVQTPPVIQPAILSTPMVPPMATAASSTPAAAPATPSTPVAASAPSGSSTTAIPLASGKRRSQIGAIATSKWNGSPINTTSAGLPPASPAPVSAAPLSAAPVEGGILLASGRAARQSVGSISQVLSSATTEPNTPSTISSPAAPATKGASGEEQPLLIASGRRRQSRNFSITPESQGSILPSNAAAAAVAAQPEHQQSAAPAAEKGPWPSAIPAAAPPAPWGTNPTAWTNPSQLTSQSSTWSYSGPTQPSQTFVDPWSRPPGSQGTSTVVADPWAQASPPSTNMVTSWGTPVTPQVQQSSFVQQQIQSIQQKQAPAAGLRIAAGAGWDNTPAKLANNWSSSAPVAPAPAPTAAAAAAVAANPSAPAIGKPFGSTGAAAPGVYFDRGNQKSAEPTKVAGDFTFSSSNRGKLLLKLKIETKSGEHQNLSVHEHDDPSQLANEFCKHYDMVAFQEPLFRLIMLRKTNAIRQRSQTYTKQR